MGRRGPKPAPTNLKLLRGERSDRINDAEPQPREGEPVLPDSVLDPLVRDIWDYTLAELSAMRIVTPADRDPLLVYCEAVAQHRRASAAIADEGIECRVANGGQGKHPAVQIQRDAASVIKAFAAEFGLTPSARSSIRKPEAKQPGGAARLLTN